jgi:uncharacterized protein
MRNPFLFYLVTTLVVLIIDIYVYQAFRTIFRDSSTSAQITVKYLFWGLTAIVLISVYSTMFMSYFHKPNAFRTYYFAVILFIMLSKLFVVLFLLIDDSVRIVRWLASFFQAENITTGGTPITRLKFISQLGIFFGLLPLALGIDGMIRNAYNYQFKRIKLKLPNLPDSFVGLKIVQISDIHSGSFTAKKPIKHAIDLINNENADIIFFTGDLVNNVATEVLPYQDIFSNLKAKEGVFSILGNHDYGDYIQWNSKEDKKKNLEHLKTIQKEMGWKLLMDENHLLTRNNDSIAIIGIQNWSTKLHFPKYGNLSKATAGTENASVKLLLSHDPSHWDAQVRTEFKDIDVMFAGHTHGAQFGIEIPGLRWSPSQYVYKQWAGLYQEANQFLYVNRGFGFLGYPGRIGILPEITVFDLQKA